MAEISAGTGNQVVGKVFILYGTVKAVSPDGTEHVLAPNSPIYADDHIITGSDGSVSIQFDGPPVTQLDLGRMTEIVIDQDVYAGVTPEVVSEAAAQAEQVQESLLQGDQPIDLEATAAGGAAGAGGGHPVVNFGLDGGEVTPGSGAGTEGITTTTVGTLGSVFATVDGTPVAGENAMLQMDDDALKGGIGDDAKGDDVETAPTSGTLAHTYGTDGAGTVLLTGVELPTEGGFTSEVSEDGLTLTIYQDQGGDGPVAVLQISLADTTSGEYEVTQLHAIDHPEGDYENNVDFTIQYKVSDSDGDHVDDGTLVINVDDDMPGLTGQTMTATVDEDDIQTHLSLGQSPNDGDHLDGSFTGSPFNGHDSGPANVSGSLAALVSFGADGPGPDGGFSLAEDLSGLVAQGLTSDGEGLSYEVVGNTLYAYVPVNGNDDVGGDNVKIAYDEFPVEGRVVFTLELDSDGGYKFSLYDQLDHEHPPEGIAQDQNNLPIDLSSAVVATDGDGDPITLGSSFTINVTDDVPKEAGFFPEVGIVEEEALPGGNQEWHDWTPDTTIATGSLASQVQVGADESVTFSLSLENNHLPELTSNGEEVTYHVDGNTLYAEVAAIDDTPAHTIFTLELQEDGHYTFTLLGQLDHSGSGEDWKGLDLSSIIVATDADGDSITLHNDFYIQVFDDIPEVSVSGPDHVAEDALPISGAWSVSIGADQPAESIKVLVNGHYYDVGTAINVVEGNQGVGTLTVNADHTWTFDPNPNLDNNHDTTFSFSIKATDADGDHASDSQTIWVKDGTHPSGGDTITLALDEDGLTGHAADGTPLHTGEVAGSGASIVPNTLSFHAGSDDLTSFRFGNTNDLHVDTNGPGVDDLHWVRNSAGTEITGYFAGTTNVAITLTLSAPSSIAYGTTGDVTVTATLSDNLQHALDNGEQTLNLGSVQVYAYDHDGDSTHGTVTLSVTDDIPTLTVAADSLTVDEDGLTGHAVDGTPLHAGEVTGTGLATATGNLADNFNFGADGQAAAAIYSVNGVTATAGHIVISTAAYNLNVTAATGDYTFTLTDNMLHDTVQGENLQALLANGIGLTVVAQDADGDKVSGAITLNVDVLDDISVAVNDSTSVTVSSLDTNLLITLDISGSMGDSSGIGGMSRLDAAKESIEKLIDAYDAKGDVMVKLVAFSGDYDGNIIENPGDAFEAGNYDGRWLTAAEAKEALGGLSPTNWTNYDAGLDAAMKAFADDGKIAGAQNISYFLSDGAPNDGGGITPEIPGDPVGDGDQVTITEWTTFVDTNNIVSFALGMGTGANLAALEPIAYNGAATPANDTTGAILVDDFGDLTQTLIGTVPSATVSGNVLTNDSPGADDGSVTYISSSSIVDHAVDADGETIAGKYGDLLIQADGHYEYTADALTGDVVKVSVSVPDDPSAHLNVNDGAYGITSTVDGDVSPGYSDEINYLGVDNDHADTKSEVMKFELQNGTGQAADGMIATKATVDITEFYSGENNVGNEVGAYELYLNGNPVQGPTTFTADKLHEVNGENGTYQLVINGPAGGFDEIHFSARSGTADSTGDADSSDYNVKQIHFDLEAKDVFTYTLTDGDGDTAHADLTIDIDLSTLIAPPEDIPV